MAELGALQDQFVQSQMAEQQEQAPGLYLGPTAQDVPATQRPPTSQHEYYMRGGPVNTLASTVKNVADRRMRQGLKKKFEQLLARGEQGVDRVYEEAVEKYGQANVSEYVPPKELFRDPQTGQIDPYKYYEHMALGIKKLKERIERDRRFRYKQKQQQLQQRRQQHLEQYRGARMELDWAKEIRLSGAEQRRTRMDQFKRYIQSEKLKNDDEATLRRHIKLVRDIKDELTEDKRTTLDSLKSDAKYNAMMQGAPLTKADTKEIEDRVNDAYQEEDKKWTAIETKLVDELNQKLRVPKKKTTEAEQGATEESPPEQRTPPSGQRPEAPMPQQTAPTGPPEEPELTPKPSRTLNEIVEVLQQTARGTGPEAEQAREWLTSKGFTW